MADFNKVFLIGNLTRNPELRYTPGGSAVCDLGLAINRRYTTSSNVEKSETCFVDIVVWGKQAQSVDRYLQKGSACFVEGRLQMDQWEDRESGRKRTKHRVVAERIQFLDRPGRGDDYQSSESDDYSSEYNQDSAGQQQSPAPPPAYQNQQVEQAPATQQSQAQAYQNQQTPGQEAAIPPPPPPKPAFDPEPMSEDPDNPMDNIPF